MSERSSDRRRRRARSAACLAVLLALALPGGAAAGKPGRPFVLRLNRFFWSDGEAAFDRDLGLARRFARRGYLLESDYDRKPAFGAYRRLVRALG